MELQKPEVIAMPTYTLGCQRQISAANYIYYADGCPHPDRIIQMCIRDRSAECGLFKGKNGKSRAAGY